jgi:uncharacterized membrane protein
MSSLRLETFSDGVFAIAITLLALQLRPPDRDGVTTVGGVLHALAEQRVQFGYYALAFVVVGGLWLEHHQLLDPMETHGRRLARINLLFLLTVSLLPYWVSVLEAHHDSGAAGGLLLFDMALTRIAFVLVCLGVRAELGASEATTELVMPTLLRSAGAVVLGLVQGGAVGVGQGDERREHSLERDRIERLINLPVGPGALEQRGELLGQLGRRTDRGRRRLRARWPGRL